MILFLLSFLAGALTVLAPCTLPLLPVIIGGSVGGEKASIKKALVVTISLAASVTIFTILLKVSTVFINVPQSVWQWISGGIILILGILTLFPDLWDKIPVISKMGKSSNKLIATGYQKQSIWGDIIIGAALGPVFSSCSPTYFLILATVLPQSPVAGFTDLIAYAVGLGVVLLIVAFVGQKILQKLDVAADPKGWFKRTLGIIFIILGLLIIFGADKVIELDLQNGGLFDITQVEQYLLQKTGGATDSGTSSGNTILNTGFDIPGAGSSTPPAATSTAHTTSSGSFAISGAERLAKKAALYKSAPEITDPSGFINTGGQPITFNQFKGKKVILVDIWTYSCINCMRTLPYVKAWYDKYSDEGLEIIGIHTPEFAFEHLLSNVQAAVTADGIKYPVVLDNNYGTWNAFGNEYWPRKYLIDVDGYIVYDKIGEGDYDVTEQAIQAALKERDAVLGLPDTVSGGIVNPSDAIALNGNAVGSPETYFGSARNQYLGNGTQGQAGTQTMGLPQQPDLNTLYLGGTWNFTDQYAQSQDASSSILYEYDAKNVYIVAASATAAPVTLKVYEDGTLVNTITVQGNQLYPLIQGTDYGTHTMRIDVSGTGLQAYTFTFG